MAFLLGCENVHLEFPAKKVFESLTLGINDGDRIGIVGRNGDGKSSLLALLSGSLAPSLGRITMRNGVSVGLLRQADALDPQATVGWSVVGDVPEYTWASDARIRGIIGDLLGDLPWEKPIAELSGGQRRRVDLARVLVADDDVLLLDEPTNHLDVRAITWLAEHLKSRWPRKSGALLVVTHDRWFLDEVCSAMWEVHSGRVEPFEGGYSAYVLQRVERDQAAQAAEQKRRNLMRKELAWLSRGPQARSTKPKFHVEAARNLIADEPPARNSLELKRSAMSRLGKQVVDLEGVTWRIGGQTVIDDVTWRIGPGDRFGILGENGVGKTTLLNLIQGVLQPTSGQVRIGQTVKFAVLSQHLDELNQFGSLRVREVLAQYKMRYEIDGQELTPAQLLERLGFESAHLSTPVSDLSGGQRRRLQLMLVLLDRPNVLILDEPDNDLDTDMLAAIESLLDSWPGTLFLITHDRYLMEHVTDDQFALIGGKVIHMPGGVDEYLRRLETRRATQAAAKAGAGTAGSPARTAPGGVPAAAPASGLSYAEKRAAEKELAATERGIAKLEAKAETIRAELDSADPSDYVTLVEIQARLDDVKRQIAELEETWMELSERLS